MKVISETLIASLAPNPAALSNGRAISQKGKIVSRSCSGDDSFFMCECTGSGKSNYVTSADFVDPDSPVLRCSCPSRQHPCKHALGLLFEMLQEKAFELCEIPQEILDKRAKKEARVEKQAEKKSAPAKVNPAARRRKLSKQMEGISLSEKMVAELLEGGVGTIGGKSVAVYRDLAKQLGDYYLPGPQLLVRRMILEIEQFQEDRLDSHYAQAVRILIRLGALLRKARAYLNEKIAQEDFEDDDSVLYEALGGVWQLERLQQLGLQKENARLLQLSFDVIYDAARQEYVDRGFWMDIDSGEIHLHCNYRPLKALKYVKSEDSAFEPAEIPLLTLYPGGLNRRVRWDAARFVPLTPGHLAGVREKAYPDLASAVKMAKNQLKNPLDEDFVALAVRYRRIGKAGEAYVLEDESGGRIALCDRPEGAGTTERLAMLPQADLLENRVLFGAFFYDGDGRRICLQPYSIVTPDRIVRLQY